MTTIAYRAGVLAADTAICQSGSLMGRFTKIARRDDGDMCGACGNATYNAVFQKWFISGEVGDPPVAKESDRSFDRAIIVRRNGTIEVFEPGGTFACDAEYYAIGSGMDYALGAMHFGANAEDAVNAAIAHDPHSGGSVTVLDR